MSKESNYQICTKCVMDTTDGAITFDGDGVCSHCVEFDTVTSKGWYPNEEGHKRLSEIVDRIKEGGKNQEYDCILGLSGGVDSSYLAIKMSELGLRPLVVHVDAGWNSELAVKNIESVVSYCNFDLHTHVVDWEEMRDLHLAYLQSGISNQDVPQDHVFFSSLYHFATKNNIRYILSGGNLATEGIFPVSWHGGAAMDSINLKAIHREFGERKLKTYSTISFFKYYFWYPMVKKMRTVRPLNYMPYDKESAIKELTQTIGWRSYGRKHGESVFTKIFQNHYLPKKFGFDKRLPHLSSLIVSGQMTRDEALKKIEEPLYDEGELEVDINFLCKKLRISREQFDEFLKPPGRYYSDYKNWDRLYRITKLIQKKIERVLGRKISVYS
jgi:N-acetyl sugar amidotransferase